MMLTPEQLADHDECALCGGTGEVQITPYGHPDSHSYVFGCPVCIQKDRDEAEQERDKLLAHLDAQQARIAELESNAEAHALAMKAGKAMLAAETARADSAEQDAARYRYIFHGCTVLLPDGTECEDQHQLDAAMKPTWPEDASDYGSRIAVIGQNGAAGAHYDEERNP